MDNLGKYEHAYTRQRLLDIRPGWTLADVDALSMQDIIECFAYEKAKQMVREDQKEKGGD